MPFGWGESEDAYKKSRDPDQKFHHEAHFSHEALAGAASFGAFKLFEDKQRKEGKPVSHAFAKELLVGIAGAEIDKLIETKGLDYIDKEKAKRHAKENVENMYDDHYVRKHHAEKYDPNEYERPHHLHRHDRDD